MVDPDLAALRRQLLRDQPSVEAPKSTDSTVVNFLAAIGVILVIVLAVSATGQAPKGAASSSVQLSKPPSAPTVPSVPPPQTSPRIQPKPSPAPAVPKPPDSQSTKVEDPIGPPQIVEVQALLAQLGYSPGLADGMLGPHTEAALTSFLSDWGTSGGMTMVDVLRRLRHVSEAWREVGISVERVQTALNRQGFNAGPADGVLGPQTRAAIVAFRSRQGLPRSERIDGALWNALSR
jgi:peptidoglycan hydrolase-like protein with peptidoglycan-binding domain